MPTRGNKLPTSLSEKCFENASSNVFPSGEVGAPLKVARAASAIEIPVGSIAHRAAASPAP
jgi:hypothetical protein